MTLTRRESDMRDVMLLGTRLVLGSYLAVHGAQKLFGSFGGPGLERAGAGFDRIGLTPGKPMAALAGATELGGGLLTVAGVADPAGPLAIIGAMTVASATHRASGPLAANRGFELPLTNLAAAAALAAAGPGRFRIGPPLSRRLTTAVVAGGAVMAAASLAKMLTAARGQAAAPAGPAPVSSPAPEAAGETGSR
jgi:putative oxidoreductase